MGEEEDVKSERSKDKVLTKKSKTGAKDQKSYITSLKDKDPDFFEFLKKSFKDRARFSHEAGKGQKMEEGREACQGLPDGAGDPSFQGAGAERVGSLVETHS